MTPVGTRPFAALARLLAVVLMWALVPLAVTLWAAGVALGDLYETLRAGFRHGREA